MVACHRTMGVSYSSVLSLNAKSENYYWNNDYFKNTEVYVPCFNIIFIGAQYIHPLNITHHLNRSIKPGTFIRWWKTMMDMPTTLTNEIRIIIIVRVFKRFPRSALAPVILRRLRKSVETHLTFQIGETSFNFILPSQLIQLIGSFQKIKHLLHCYSVMDCRAIWHAIKQSSNWK